MKEFLQQLEGELIYIEYRGRDGVSGFKCKLVAFDDNFIHVETLKKATLLNRDDVVKIEPLQGGDSHA